MTSSGEPPLGIAQRSVGELAETRWDAIVVGAGPAGATAARVLARGGRRVLLVDAERFPRDKVCGDALIPDALRVLERLDLIDEVRALGHAASTLSLYSAARAKLDVRSTFVTMRRQRFDALLVRKAIEAGACFALGRVEALIPQPDGSIRARFRGVDAAVAASAGLTATGASVDLLRGHGLVSRPEANAMALRCYVKSDERIDELVVSYDRAIAPGYAWIFPVGDGVYNVGCGTTIVGDGRRINLRRDFQTFVEHFPLARSLMRRASQVTRLEGARLRCGLSGVHPIGPQTALSIGEAIGATFPLTGEGIGKAIETGVLGAEAVAHALDGGGAPALGDYARRVERELKPRYLGYEIAQRWVKWPRLGDFVVRRAGRSRYLQDAIAGILEERVDPRAVFSLGGLARSWVR
jgi:geranylgeranyl reductase family protein